MASRWSPDAVPPPRNSSSFPRRKSSAPLPATSARSPPRLQDIRSAIASFSCRSVNGLLRNPFAPRSMASTAVALSASAEITRIRTAGFNCTSFEMHSMPSICGMVRSMVTMSGSVLRNISRASSPLPAVPTTCSSSNCCERSIRRRMMFESSTMSSLSDRRPPFPLPCFPLMRAASSDRRARRLGGGQHDLEAREAARVRAHPDLAAKAIHCTRYHVHSNSSPRVHGDTLLCRETGTEDEGHGRAGVHRSGFLRGDDVLAHGRILQHLRGDTGAVILEHQLVSVAGAAEVDAHRASLRLRQRAARLGRLDAVDGGIAQHLDEAVLHRRYIRGRHVAEP